MAHPTPLMSKTRRAVGTHPVSAQFSGKLSGFLSLKHSASRQAICVKKGSLSGFAIPPGEGGCSTTVQIWLMEILVDPRGDRQRLVENFFQQIRPKGRKNFAPPPKLARNAHFWSLRVFLGTKSAIRKRIKSLISTSARNVGRGGSGGTPTREKNPWGGQVAFFQCLAKLLFKQKPGWVC